MPLTTYTELKAAIASRLHRTDLTTQIVDYITLAEVNLNRSLDLPFQETESTLTAVVSSRSLTLPALFNTPVALYLTTYLPRIELEYRLPKDMQVYSSNGPAQYWTIDGTVLNVNTPADKAYTYSFRYLASYNLASTNTNSLLTNHPDLYLFGALVEAADDIKDDASLQKFKARYDIAYKAVMDNANAMRSISKLTTEFATPSRPNIIRGI